jgi:hypothetical protein
LAFVIFEGVIEMQATSFSHRSAAQGLGMEFVLSLALVFILVIAMFVVLDPMLERGFNESNAILPAAGAGSSAAGCTADFVAWCDGISGTPVCSGQSSTCYTGY